MPFFEQETRSPIRVKNLEYCTQSHFSIPHSKASPSVLPITLPVILLSYHAQRVRDSNPRSFRKDNGFQDRRFRPLSQPSSNPSLPHAYLLPPPSLPHPCPFLMPIFFPHPHYPTLVPSSCLSSSLTLTTPPLSLPHAYLLPPPSLPHPCPFLLAYLLPLLGLPPVWLLLALTKVLLASV